MLNYNNFLQCVCSRNSQVNANRETTIENDQSKREKNINLNNKTKNKPIAGQTAGPNGLKFCVDTQGWPEGVLAKKNREKYFFSNFFPWVPGPLVSIP